MCVYIVLKSATFSFIYVCVCVRGYMCIQGCLWRPEQGVAFLGAEVTGFCELAAVSAGI